MTAAEHELLRIPRTEPLWMAMQDGPNAPWVTVTPVGDVYTMNPAQSRVGLVYVWSTQFRHHVIRYMTRNEFSTRGGRLCAPDQTGVFLQLTPPNNLNVYRGSFSNAVNTVNTTGTTTISAATRLVGLASAYWYTTGAERVSIIRDVDTRNASSATATVLPIDYSTASPVTPTAVTITNLAGRDPTYRLTSLYSMGQVWRPDLNAYGAGCVSNELRLNFPLVGAATAQATPIPANRLLPTDAQSIAVQTLIESGVRDNEESIVAYYRTTPPTTVELPDPLGAVTQTLISSTPIQFRFQFALPSSWVNASISHSGTISGQAITMTATSGYINGSTFDFTTPNFRGVSGYSDLWLGTGSFTTWTASANGGTFGSIDACAAGEGTSYSLYRQSSSIPTLRR